MLLKFFEKWYLPFGLILVSWLKWPGAWLAFSQGKWLGVYFVALCVTGLALVRLPRLPRLKIWETVFYGLVIAGAFAQLFYFSPRGFEFVFSDRSSFLLLLLGSWGAFQRRLLRWQDFWWPLALSITVVSGIGLWQMWEIGFPGQMPYLAVGSTFGHANHAAQFLGIALLMWWSIPRPRISWWIQPALSGFALTYFLLLRCRSTFVGMALGLLVLAAFRYRREGRAFVKKPAVWGSALVLFAAFAGFQLARGKSLEDLVHLKILSEKSSMFIWRGDVWRQTVEMIRENPLGIGPDRFPFQFIPYHARGTTLTENGIADTPHNEVLRYLAEDGVVLGPLYLIAILLLVGRWLKRKEEWSLLLPTLAFIAVEGLTQFPFYCPFPSYILALILGYMATKVWPKELAVSKRSWVRVVVGMAFAVQLFITTKVVIARSYEHADTLEKAELSCRMVPLNWKSCLMQTKLELDKNDLNAARASAEEILFDDPWNFSAMRYLSIVAYRQGDHLEACFYLWKYDHIFYDHSSIHDRLAQNCLPKWLTYFAKKKPSTYMPRYSAFMERKKRERFSSLRFWE
ncbi:MAG: O-antigen ligase family protein [Bdellovibrionota bacterium]